MSGYQFLNDVPAAVIKVSRVIPVAGVVIRQSVCSKEQINGAKGSVGRTSLDKSSLHRA
jgi:hypothetical protein